jgi:undecaprenyl-diphosphatase
VVFSSSKAGTRPDPLNGPLAPLLWLGAALTSALAALAWAMLHHAPMLELDHALAARLHAYARDAGLTPWVLGLTHWHSTPGLLLMCGAAAAWLLWRKQAQWLPLLVCTVPGAMLLNLGLKHSFQRARPAFEDPVVMLHTFSFPSGHAVGGAVWYGWLALYLGSRLADQGARAAVWGAALCMAAMVGISRLYLGAHYLSDVLAGWAEGGAWLCLCLAVQRWYGQLPLGGTGQGAAREGRGDGPV